MKDSVGCRLFNLHVYKELLNNDKYIVKQCELCKNYIVTYKAYNIKNKFKLEELPSNLNNKIKHRCQA